MKCAEFDFRLNELLDLRESPHDDEQLRAHTVGCGECREALQAFAALQDGLDLAEAPEPSADFAQQVVAVLQAEDSTRSTAKLPATKIPVSGGRRAALLAAALAVVAALLLVASIPAMQRLLSPPPLDTVNVDSDSQNNQQPAPREVIPDHKPEIAQEQQGTGNQFAGTGLLDTLPELPNFSEIDSDKIPGVRPFTNSMGVAFSLLRRALPGGKSTAPTKPQARMVLNGDLLG